MFGSSIPSVVSSRTTLFTLFVFICYSIVVSNTYCLVFFALFFCVLCLVYGGVQHVLRFIFYFVYLRLMSYA